MTSSVSCVHILTSPWPSGTHSSYMMFNLHDHDYRSFSELYYIKPGCVPPEGLVMLSCQEDVDDVVAKHHSLSLVSLVWRLERRRKNTHWFVLRATTLQLFLVSFYCHRSYKLGSAKLNEENAVLTEMRSCHPTILCKQPTSAATSVLTMPSHDPIVAPS
jgi:hypothetical protein